MNSMTIFKELAPFEFQALVKAFVDNFCDQYLLKIVLVFIINVGVKKKIKLNVLIIKLSVYKLSMAYAQPNFLVIYNCKTYNNSR